MRSNARKAVSLLAAVLFAGAATACDSNDGGTGPDPLAVPANVVATSTGTTTARVTWNQVSEAESYQVERALGAGAFAQVATGLTQTSYDDTGLTPSTEYRYRVRAVAGARSSDFSAAAAATTGTPGPKIAFLSGRISANRTLFADSLYVLQGFVKVDNAAVLTIQPGTRIVGDTLAANRGSSLWILRGSRLMAEGTAAAPIVFTSWRAPGARRPGDWGGIVIIGNAPINRTANPIFTEGPVGASENYAGGTVFNDNSGSLRYVRIEFAGYDVSNGSGQELNGLSMYAVGRGTKLEYVQVMSGLDDSFEWWGGAADGRYLVSYEAGDDHFDWTEGFRGRNQFLIGYQTTTLQPAAGTGTLSSDPRGFEGDGCDSATAGCTFANQPFSSPVFANFTLIGPGAGVFAQNDGNGAVVRRGSAGTFVNGVIGRWPGVGFSIRNTESDALRALDSLVVRNVHLVDNGANFEPAGTNFGAALSAAGYANTTGTGVTALFAALPAAGVAPTTATLDWTPAAGGALTAGGLADFTGTVVAGRVTSFLGTANAVAATSYRGAADPAGADWWAGWTNYARN